MTYLFKIFAILSIFITIIDNVEHLCKNKNDFYKDVLHNNK